MKTETLIEKTKSELEALNNMIVNYKLIGYKIHKYQQQDKREKQKYFLADDKETSLTGHWEYSELNHFIMGYGKLKAINDALLSALKEIIKWGKIKDGKFYFHYK